MRMSQNFVGNSNQKSMLNLKPNARYNQGM